MKTLILDNYDSFTFNLMQVVAELGGNPIVLRNDGISLDGVRDLQPTHIIISPGPGNPYEVRDIGISEELVEYAAQHEIPLLGVCLGHQVLTKHFGATVERAPRPFHGKASRITYVQQCPLFRGLPRDVDVMRYHSLHAPAETITAPLSITARTEDGVVMAVEHAHLPLYGVQFHPESIGTPAGKTIVHNFLSLRARAALRHNLQSVLQALFAESATDSEREQAFHELVLLPITVDLVVCVATFLRDRMRAVDLPGNPIDTCGTGGSGKRTLNTSTLTAFLVAACGGKVAKHGNRSATGMCGSFDLLEHLGVRIDLSPDEERRMYEELGITFLFAPLHHPVMRSVAPLRKQYGKKTIFNLVGPLLNPASVRHQVLGTPSLADGDILAAACRQLGTEQCLVVTGLDGLDEVSPCAPSMIRNVATSSTSYFLPSDIGLPPSSLDIEGGSTEVNARIFLDLAAGGGSDAQRHLVLLNAAHALVVAGLVSTVQDGFLMARDTLLSGIVHQLFSRYREYSTSCS